MKHTGYFMGIDAGTTGTTVLIMDEKWNVAAKGYQKHIMNSPKPGWMEQDANVLWEDLLCAVKKALSQLPLNAQILGIGFDHQGESCLIWEKSTGNPLSQAINWQDRRTVSAVEELAAKYGEEIQKRTGFFPDSYFSAEKFVWELEQIPNGHQRAENGELCAGTLGSWFLWKMTGGKIHMTDPSTASRTMLYNIHSGEWDDEILEILSLPHKMLPKIGSSAQRFGMTQPQCFLGLQVPVSGLIVDQQAALFGQCCFHTGMIKTTYGTGCFLLMNTGQTPIKSPGGLLTTVAWNLGGKDTFALDGGIYTAGAAVNWLREKMGMIESFEQTQQMAESVQDNGGIYFVPAFVGLAAPHWDSCARGTIFGINSMTGKEQIVRATLESIAYQVSDNLDVMIKDSGVPIGVMRADGGMAVNSFLMQFQADILNIPVDVPVISETSSLGAAYLAAFGEGWFSSLSEIESNWQLQCRYEPKMSEDERQTLLYNWHRAVQRSLGWLQKETP